MDGPISQPIVNSFMHSCTPLVQYNIRCQFVYCNRCLICNAKIARVKNNRSGGPGENPDGRPEQSIPVHVRGRTTNIMTRSAPGEMVPKRMPTSVSGYSLCPSTTSSGQEQNHNKRATNGMPLSHSSYSMSSGGWELGLKWPKMGFH